MFKKIARAFLLQVLVINSALGQINIPHFVFSGMHNLSEGKFVDAIRSLNVVIAASPEMYEPYFYRGLQNII